jgi:hypothetical protein
MGVVVAEVVGALAVDAVGVAGVVGPGVDRAMPASLAMF